MYLSPVPLPYRSTSFGLLRIFLAIQCGAVCAMAPFTVLGSPAIDANNPAIDFFLLHVTLRATDPAVRAIQGIFGLAVIERGRAPF